MDAILYETCTKHGLRGLGVNVFGAPARPYIGVYVHWRAEDGYTCASGTGQTFDEALTVALAEMDERKRLNAHLAMRDAAIAKAEGRAQ